MSRPGIKPTTQACALQVWESNLQPFGHRATLQPAEPRWPGLGHILFYKLSKNCLWARFGLGAAIVQPLCLNLVFIGLECTNHVSIYVKVGIFHYNRSNTYMDFP